MKILVTGATGFVGKRVSAALYELGFEVFGLVHRSPSLAEGITPIKAEQLNSHHFDVLINLAGENIAAARWTPERKSALLASREDVTNFLFDTLTLTPKVVVSMSAVGYYGTHPNRIFHEYTPPIEGFTHDLCARWEQAANRFTENGARVAIFRLGVVLGHGGALDKMRLPFLLGLGGPIGNGEHWFPWIHMDDVVNLIINAISDERYQGPFNAVSPDPIKQKVFANAYAASLHRPSILPTPKFVLKLAFGEMSELLVQGQKVIPERLTQLHYEFKFANIHTALANIAKPDW